MLICPKKDAEIKKKSKDNSSSFCFLVKKKMDRPWASPSAWAILKNGYYA